MWHRLASNFLCNLSWPWALVPSASNFQWLVYWCGPLHAGQNLTRSKRPFSVTFHLPQSAKWPMSTRLDNFTRPFPAMPKFFGPYGTALRKDSTLNYYSEISQLKRLSLYLLTVTLSLSPNIMLFGVRSRWTILFSLCRYRRAKHSLK